VTPSFVLFFFKFLDVQNVWGTAFPRVPPRLHHWLQGNMQYSEANYNYNYNYNV